MISYDDLPYWVASLCPMSAHMFPYRGLVGWWLP